MLQTRIAKGFPKKFISSIPWLPQNIALKFHIKLVVEHLIPENEAWTVIGIVVGKKAVARILVLIVVHLQ